jgi:hypothetical protein
VSQIALDSVAGDAFHVFKVGYAIGENFRTEIAEERFWASVGDLVGLKIGLADKRQFAEVANEWVKEGLRVSSGVVLELPVGVQILLVGVGGETPGEVTGESSPIVFDLVSFEKVCVLELNLELTLALVTHKIPGNVFMGQHVASERLSGSTGKALLAGDDDLELQFDNLYQVLTNPHHCLLHWRKGQGRPVPEHSVSTPPGILRDPVYHVGRMKD